MKAGDPRWVGLPHALPLVAALLAILMAGGSASGATTAPTFARADYALFGNNYVVGDFNGNGSLDLAGVGTAAKVRLNNGAGAFGAVVDYAIGGQGQDIAAGDFNGDGRLDLVVTINNPQIGLSLLAGNGDGTFGAPLTGDFRHLHDFVISDGENPTGKLFQASDGFFYGTTNQGGPWNSGVVYKVDVAGNFVLLHGLSPLWPGEGSDSKSGVIQASDGYFYGTTESGYGGIFRMDAAGNFTVVHRFDPYASDGWRPVSGLIEGRDGFLYGTAPSGGRTILAPSAYGVVYRLNLAREFELLHSFSGPDGNRPIAGLLQAADGMLSGTTSLGGAFGMGVVFRIGTAPVAEVPLPTLFGLAFDSWTVTGGQSATGSVRLGGPAPLGGAVVTLSTSSSLVSVPATVTVPYGAWAASFTVSTEPWKKTKSATVTARYNGGSISASLSITR